MEKNNEATLKLPIETDTNNLFWVRQIKVSGHLEEINNLLREGWRVIRIFHTGQFPLFVLGQH